MLVAGAAIWLLATRRPAWALSVVVAILALELLGSAVWSQTTALGDTVRVGLEGGEHPNLVPQPLPSPEVDASAFTTPTAFVPRLLASQDRYLTWAPPAAYFEKGYLFMQLAPDWPALAMERGSLFGVRDVLGYNPVQLPRYWNYMHARTSLPLFYNAAVIDLPEPRDVRLLGARYLIVPTGITAPLAGKVVDRAQGYDLVDLDDRQPLASLVSDWRVVGSSNEALDAVLAPSFDASTLAVLETDPGFPPAGEAPPGRAFTTERTPEDVTIDVEASSPSILVVRTGYDPGWTATLDGHQAKVLATDGFLQGVAVPTGNHEIRLTYLDDAVTRGVIAGAVVWGLLCAAFVVTWSHERRRARVHARGDRSHRELGAGERLSCAPPPDAAAPTR
jgi:hypothetical protein